MVARQSITIDDSRLFGASGGSGQVGPSLASEFSFSAPQVSVINGGTIDTSVVGAPGSVGGNVDVSARVAVFDGGRHQRRTGIFADAEEGLNGAGSISVLASRVYVSRGASLSSSAEHLFDPGGGDNPVDGGSVSVNAGQDVVINGGIVSAKSSFGDAGGVTIAAGQSIHLDHGTVTAQATGKAGNVELRAPVLIDFARDSNVSALSSAGNGGNVLIDPLILQLGRGSTIVANGANDGGHVRISATSTPGVVVGGPNPNVTAKNGAGLSGSVNTGPAQNDVINALSRLPGGLAKPELVLQPQCGESTSSFSSFLVTGLGGLPFDPQVWQWPASSWVPPPAPAASTQPAR